MDWSDAIRGEDGAQVLRGSGLFVLVQDFDERPLAQQVDQGRFPDLEQRKPLVLHGLPVDLLMRSVLFADPAHHTL